MSKNVKWYLKDTNRQVCLGDEVTFKQSINFSRYPNTTFETTATHPLDEEDIKAFIEAGLIYGKEEKPIEEYTIYLKWLAEKRSLEYSAVLQSFSFTLKLNPKAALVMLLQAISLKNFGDKFTTSKPWVINLATLEPCLVDIVDMRFKTLIAWFPTKEDAEYALKVCEPIIKQL